jgi:hypothetical protein
VYINCVGSIDLVARSSRRSDNQSRRNGHEYNVSTRNARGRETDLSIRKGVTPMTAAVAVHAGSKDRKAQRLLAVTGFVDEDRWRY